MLTNSIRDTQRRSNSSKTYRKGSAHRTVGRSFYLEKPYNIRSTSPEKRRKSGQITQIHRTSPEKHLLYGETTQSHSTSLTFRGIMSERDTFDRYTISAPLGRHVTACGIYSRRTLKASSAAQPKGCSACFVPSGLYLNLTARPNVHFVDPLTAASINISNLQLVRIPQSPKGTFLVKKQLIS